MFLTLKHNDGGPSRNYGGPSRNYDCPSRNPRPNLSLSLPESLPLFESTDSKMIWSKAEEQIFASKHNRNH